MKPGPVSLPLHPSRRQQRLADTDNSPSAFHIEQAMHPSSTAKTNTIYTPAHLSSRVKAVCTPRRSPSSSSSSDESLAPVPHAFKRWRHPRHPLFAALPRKHCKSDGPLSPAPSMLDQVDERSSSTTAVPLLPKLGIQKMLSSARCASFENRQSIAIDSVFCNELRSVDLHSEEAPIVTGADIDAEKEDKRKLSMWHAACAMAHAYLHRHDQHQHDLHRHDQHQYDLHQHDRHQRELHQCRQHDLSLHIPQKGHFTCNVDDKSRQENGPLLQEETSDLQQATEHTNNSVSSSSPVCTTGSKDRVHTPSTWLPSDLVCIDEVVNPTQAAEWFGALFSSSSTLVS